tara:strand:+ start:121 stop:414 length:294 start_codon:yes stop_codon:yes gene_type:complete
MRKFFLIPLFAVLTSPSAVNAHTEEFISDFYQYSFIYGGMSAACLANGFLDMPKNKALKLEDLMLINKGEIKDKGWLKTIEENKQEVYAVQCPELLK